MPGRGVKKCGGPSRLVPARPDTRASAAKPNRVGGEAMGGVGSGGHNRKSPDEHILAGTFREDRHGSAVRALAPAPAVAPSPLPPPPADLSRQMRDEWNVYMSEYGPWPPGHLRVLHLALQALDQA